MSKMLWRLTILLLLCLMPLPLAADDDACLGGLPARLEVGKQGRVDTSEGFYLNVREEPGLSPEPFIRLARGEVFKITAGPRCLDNINWWQIEQFGLVGWVAEASGPTYLIAPFDLSALPPLLPPPVINLAAASELPPVPPLPNPTPDLQTDFITWDWDAHLSQVNSFWKPADPLGYTLPERFMGEWPEAPFDLNEVRFVTSANLTPAQMALLAQNGFVIVPGGMTQFEDAYRGDENWNPETGHSYWVTTDSVLHGLYIVFDNLLTFLEMDELYDRVTGVVAGAYASAATQADLLDGAPGAEAARHAALYYAVALGLLEPEIYAQAVADDLRAEAAPLIAAAQTAQGRLPVPFLSNYQEDFSQYIIRGHYASAEVLERYFRGMMWLGRITFLSRDDDALLTSLFVLRALDDSGMYEDWAAVSDVLAFLIGPEDNIGPADYLPLAREIFGADLAPDALADRALRDQFSEALRQLPPPLINNVVRPIGTETEELDAATRGFRLFGQRFTFDSYVMQRLIYPHVGEAGAERALPSGLDVAAALGSDVAYGLLAGRGDTAFTNYTENMTELRETVAQMQTEDWLQNVAGAWLWTLQPLWVRDAEVYPAFMNSQPWLLRELHASMGSWTELKHATLLYTAQPMGGLGGGGERVPTTHGFVEPNPLVFSRVAVVSAALYQGLAERNLLGRMQNDFVSSGLMEVTRALPILSQVSAIAADMAQKTLWGIPLTEAEQYYLKYNFANHLWNVRYQAELPLAEPPRMAAIVTDVASNPDSGEVLQVGTGFVDYIYVITDSPDGLQLTRGSVYSFYEFTGDIDRRLDDATWRDRLDAGDIPPRPDWVSAFLAE